MTRASSSLDSYDAVISFIESRLKTGNRAFHSSSDSTAHEHSLSVLADRRRLAEEVTAVRELKARLTKPQHPLGRDLEDAVQSLHGLVG